MARTYRGADRQALKQARRNDRQARQTRRTTRYAATNRNQHED